MWSPDLITLTASSAVVNLIWVVFYFKFVFWFVCGFFRRFFTDKVPDGLVRVSPENRYVAHRDDVQRIQSKAHADVHAVEGIDARGDVVEHDDDMFGLSPAHRVDPSVVVGRRVGHAFGKGGRAVALAAHIEAEAAVQGRDVEMQHHGARDVVPRRR